MAESVSSAEQFEQRARDFLLELKMGTGYVEVYRDKGHDVHCLKVGTGIHSGLVFKDGKVSHAKQANEYYHMLKEYFKRRGYEPYSYELFEVRFFPTGERMGVVQEYFDRPSLNELSAYLGMKNWVRGREKNLKRDLNPAEIRLARGKFGINPDNELRCTQFLGLPQNATITLEQIVDVRRELKEDTDYLRMYLKPENVMVLQQRIGGESIARIGLAIIDY
jgi:hypothetical protein